ncbi:hypothetical protein [Pseudalkalibacillus decolorationis]|uniref:hypothetical protein n=1 Tax=Pseudalkalibacillus decolorationis TaxID=163879 RepID=UPI002147687A|nr:hypothetical protein [Pseudalkalibacillus decolorationis]
MSFSIEQLPEFGQLFFYGYVSKIIELKQKELEIGREKFEIIVRSEDGKKLN